MEQQLDEFEKATSPPEEITDLPGLDPQPDDGKVSFFSKNKPKVEKRFRKWTWCK